MPTRGTDQDLGAYQELAISLTGSAGSGSTDAVVASVSYFEDADAFIFKRQ